jgi:hypothetical protein
LLSASAALGACPVAPPPDPDGGGGDADEADAGAGDAGAADGGVCDCGRDPPPFDAGTSEAPMGGCWPLREPIDDLVTDAGLPIYEHCYFESVRDPCCGPAECGDTEAEIRFLDAILAIAEARGYPPSMQLIELGASEYTAGAAFLVSIDWYETVIAIDVTANGDGVISEQAIADEMPLWIPTSMPPIVWAAVRTCDEGALPYFCLMSGPYVPIKLVGECGRGSLVLWDPDIVGSGMSEPVCYPSDRPCCSWTEYP